jgi:hypothetical protein
VERQPFLLRLLARLLGKRGPATAPASFLIRRLAIVPSDLAKKPWAPIANPEASVVQSATPALRARLKAWQRLPARGG